MSVIETWTFTLQCVKLLLAKLQKFAECLTLHAGSHLAYLGHTSIIGRVKIFSSSCWLKTTQIILRLIAWIFDFLTFWKKKHERESWGKIDWIFSFPFFKVIFLDFFLICPHFVDCDELGSNTFPTLKSKAGYAP